VKKQQRKTRSPRKQVR